MIIRMTAVWAVIFLFASASVYFYGKENGALQKRADALEAMLRAAAAPEGACPDCAIAEATFDVDSLTHGSGYANAAMIYAASGVCVAGVQLHRLEARGGQIILTAYASDMRLIDEHRELLLATGAYASVGLDYAAASGDGGALYRLALQ